MLTRAIVPTAKHETQVSYNAIKQSFVYNGIKREITRTYYDRTKFSNIQAGFAQENLRPRVASVTYQDIEGVNYDRATHYSYDVHGNVKSLIQEINAGGVALKKRMDYDYDLVSGKVNYFYYQKDKEDQLIHKYEYDGDNRIVKVFTSRDAITWDRDAKYDYYAHGPLAKTTIGEHEVETNTYAYTIQGWIKGVNGNSFSYALGYFNDGVHQDYQGIGGGSNYTLSTPIAESGLADDKSLFNGNIATMASKTPYFAVDPAQYGPTTWTQQFEYDQLNRIKQSSSLGWVVNGQAVPDAFKTSYDYDAGGNITKLNRADMGGNQFDAMAYNYENTASGQNYKTNTNKLRWVDDTEPVADYDGDIDDQSSNNYNYDDIGNLITDESEEIANIEWTVYGKVRSVTRKPNSIKPDLEFAYDANGNRVLKSVKNKDGSINITTYLRDASGNVLSIYENNIGATATLAEQFVYGSSRVGTLKPVSSIGVNSHSIGLKEYEVIDHLSNVRVVLSDRQVSGNANVISATDYLPFGMAARIYNNENYRYGMNGQEKVDEISGSGNHYTAQFWEYDSRLGRRWNLDPKPMVGVSRYACFNNNPIWLQDMKGDTPTVAPTAMDYSTLESNYNTDGQSILEKEGSALNYLANKETNTCAIRMSECLNASGYPIPKSQDTPADVRVQNGNSKDNGNYILDAKSMSNYLNDIEAPTYKFTSLQTNKDIADAIAKIHTSDDMKGIMVLTAGDQKAYGATGHVDLIYEDWGWDLSIYSHSAFDDLDDYLMLNKDVKFTLEVWVLEKD